MSRLLAVVTLLAGAPLSVAHRGLFLDAFYHSEPRSTCPLSTVRLSRYGRVTFYTPNGEPYTFQYSGAFSDAKDDIKIKLGSLKYYDESEGICSKMEAVHLNLHQETVKVTWKDGKQCLMKKGGQLDRVGYCQGVNPDGTVDCTYRNEDARDGIEYITMKTDGAAIFHTRLKEYQLRYSLTPGGGFKFLADEAMKREIEKLPLSAGLFTPFRRSGRISYPFIEEYHDEIPLRVYAANKYAEEGFAVVTYEAVPKHKLNYATDGQLIIDKASIDCLYSAMSPKVPITKIKFSYGGSVELLGKKGEV
ncbi:hypothetical protein FOL47_000673 [Perkinsus chesapeaki]|uniref:Uncharacterized protein n=1 Tax=Perkinsus chesapeaki TaxID=330153 RepID=A0A7J6KWZ3_PERCH|nr:hypothetical protein FOL47_000673 [Perkinsus chesapeaki]